MSTPEPPAKNARNLTDAKNLMLPKCPCGATRWSGRTDCSECIQKPAVPKPLDDASSFHFFEVLLDSVEDAHPGSKKFYNAIIEAALLHSQKQRDYGRTEDPFANVRAAEEWGIPGWVGAMIRANDKIRRLQTFAVNGTLANEGVRDSFLDLAVYSLIALVLYEETLN